MGGVRGASVDAARRVVARLRSRRPARLLGQMCRRPSTARVGVSGARWRVLGLQSPSTPARPLYSTLNGSPIMIRFRIACAALALSAIGAAGAQTAPTGLTRDQVRAELAEAQR